MSVFFMACDLKNYLASFEINLFFIKKKTNYTEQQTKIYGCFLRFSHKIAALIITVFLNNNNTLWDYAEQFRNKD